MSGDEVAPAMGSCSDGEVDIGGILVGFCWSAMLMLN